MICPINKVMKNHIFRTFIFTFACFLSNNAFAQSAAKGVSFQGVIKTPAGDFPTISGTTVLVKILSPNDCILREESFSGVNISNGYLNLVVGRGVPTANNPVPARDLEKVMNNAAVITGLTCLNPDGSTNSSLTSYTPQSVDTRKLRVSLVINQDNVVADFNMRAVAYAINAEKSDVSDNAFKLNGKTSSEFIQTSANVTQANLENWFSNSFLSQIVDGTYNAPTATTAVSANTAIVAVSAQGLASGYKVPLAQGGTNASNATDARTNLGLGKLAELNLPSPLDPNKYLKGDGTWGSIVGGVSSVAGRGGDVVITSADLADFNISVQAQISLVKAQASGLASLDSSGKIPSNQLNIQAADLPDIDASKITTGNITRDVVSNSVSATHGRFTNSHIYDGQANYLTFSYPSGGTSYVLSWPMSQGGANTFLKNDGTGGLSWVTLPSAPVTSVAGRTGVVTLTDADISGLGTSATRNVPNSGDASGLQVVLGSDSRLSNSRVPTGSAGGDLAGSYPNPSVAKVQGKAYSSTAPTEGQVYRYNAGTSQFEPVFFGIDDLRTSTGSQQFAASCTSTQTLTWSAVTDGFSCTNISGLAASVISSGIIDAARLPASATYWEAATGGINFTSGKVGIGSATPGAKLHVEGGIRAQQICDTNGANCKTIANGWNEGAMITSIATISGASYSIVAADKGKLFLVSSGATLTLPTAASAGSGFFVTIKRTGTSSVKVNASGSETIDGQSSLSLGSQYLSLVLVSNGTSWFILNGSASNYEVPLYTYTTHTFTNCGQTGNTGPSLAQCKTAYSSTTWANTYLNMTVNGIQIWTVPRSGSYKITAAGAMGGTYQNTGAPGARMIGTFQLIKGESLSILVGQKGGNGNDPHGNENGGGGGTFVIRGATGSNPLIIAGGGGGAPSSGYGTSCSRSISHGYGQASNNAANTTCYSTLIGATGGNGGTTTGSNVGAAGGGLNTNGQSGPAHCSTALGGNSFVNGGVGGSGGSCYVSTHIGGFGGGGAGALGAPGGGGGYAGGSVSGNWSSYSTWGGGGSSYNIGTSQTNTDGANSDHGYITIEYIGN